MNFASQSSQHPPDRRLRLMFVITSMPVGGAEVLLVNLIRGLDRRRFAPELCCLKEPGPLGEQLADEVPTHSRIIRHKYDVAVLWKLTKLMRARKIDAVVTVGAGDKMFWGRLAAKLAGVPAICSALHSTGWPDGVGRLNRLLTPLTDAFIGVAKRHGDFLVEYERFPASKVCVIPNGVDTDRFCPRPEAAARLRHELGIPADAPVAGLVAALRPEKNHALFLEVAAHVRKAIPTAHFVLVGDGPEKGRIQSEVERLSLTGCVHLMGTRSDVPEVLSMLDVFLLTSDNEASPVSILEAMAVGLPVVATQVGSVPESVAHGETGFLAPARDAHALAHGVRQLLADSELRSHFGAAARTRVTNTGSLTAMISGYERLLGDLYCRKRKLNRTTPSSVADDAPAALRA